MLGIYFYLQILFAVLLLWASSTALYMGVFHAHRDGASLRFKTAASCLSVLLASVFWYGMYSWTYLSW